MITQSDREDLRTNGGRLLSVTHISKAFDSVVVLKDVSFDLLPGEIHALLGQNGSGKSTFIKVLSGYHAPEVGGTLTIRGAQISLPLGPGEASRLGIAFVHQDLGLVGPMSVVDNLAVGRYRQNSLWSIDWAAERQRAAELLLEFGVKVETQLAVAKIGNGAERALIAIARAVASIRDRHESGVLVLDEPTVYLPQTDVDRLKQVIRNLAGKGVGVIYVTHRIDELAGFADRVTVLRDGVRIDTVDAANLSTTGIVRMILGHEAEDGRAKGVRIAAGVPPVLRLLNLSGQFLRDVSLDLKPGEVVGVTGLLGMGQEELPYLVYGAAKARGGAIQLRGQEFRKMDPIAATTLGMVLVPSDRGRRAAIMSETASANMSLPVLRHNYYLRGWLRKGLEVLGMTQLMEDFGVVPIAPQQLLGRFSGGNQQKAILAKWLQLKPAVILLDEPTQGVDVGAKQAVLDRIVKAAKDGAAVLISSVDYEDLARICDRVLVFRNGTVNAELAGTQLTKANIAAKCYSA